MLACSRLRIDPGNGSPAVDYRIESGFVESRTLETDAAKGSMPAIEKPWQRLTPKQLTSRVMADRVVAQWLRHRMGLHGLIRACSQEFVSLNSLVLKSNERTAANAG
jgi:hypothetical protein